MASKDRRIASPKEIIRLGRSSIWRLYIGSKVLPPGSKPEVQHFGTEEAAETERQLRLARLTREGQAGEELSTQERAQAISAFARLAMLPVPVTLTDVVQFYFDLRVPPKGSLTVAEVCKLRLASKKGGPRYKRLLKIYFDGFCERFGEMPIHNVPVAEIEAWLLEPKRGGENAKPWSHKTQHNVKMALSSLWKVAVKRGGVGVNVIGEIDGITKPSAPQPGIINTAAAKTLLDGAAVHDPELAPVLALALFCGLRRSELLQLDWREVDFQDKSILVTKLSSKTGQKRRVPMPEAAAAWLRRCRKEAGPVAVWAESVRDLQDSEEDRKERFRRVTRAELKEGKRRRSLLSKVKMTLPRNALRHSAATFSLAIEENAAMVAERMGNTVKVLGDHYADRGVKRADAKAMFALRPPKLIVASKKHISEPV